jgi:hypothetical protein
MVISDLTDPRNLRRVSWPGNLADGIRLPLDDPRFGESLANYLLLTLCPEHVSATLSLRAGTDEFFYARVFWFSAFRLAFTTAEGPDAGIEQQYSQVLETAPSSVDWARVEDIERRAERYSSTASVFAKTPL